MVISGGPPYSVAGCGASFPLQGNELLLAALRAQIRDGATRLVGNVGASGVNLVVGNRAVQADEHGWFALEGLRPGTHPVRVAQPGYVMKKADPAEVRARRCTVRRWEVVADGRISGRVVARGDGKPIGGLRVFAFLVDEDGDRGTTPANETKTDATGRYLLRPLAAGSYEIVVDEDGDLPTTEYGRPVRLDAGGSRAGINLVVRVPESTREIRVRVEGRNGALQGGVTVTMSPEGESRVVGRAVSGADGIAVLRGSVGERYVVRAGGEGDSVAEAGVTEVTLRVRTPREAAEAARERGRITGV